MKTGLLISKLTGAAVFAVAGALSLSMTSTANALPLDTGNNNLSGAAAGLAENYVNTLGGDEYRGLPALGGVNPAGELPGHFESIRLVAGVPVGINIAQPALINAASGDARSGYGNALAPAPYTGLPIYGARNGIISRFDANTTSSNVYNLQTPTGDVVGFAYNLTPKTLLFPPAIPGFTDDGLAPGSVAGDGIADWVPFAFGGTALLNFYDSTTDPSGALGVFTPKVKLFEGGNPFTLAANGSGLSEGDWNHLTGPTGGTLADAIDGDLLLEGEVISAPTATLSWVLSGAGTIADPYKVLMSVVASGGIVKYTNGKLIDDGKVVAGSTGSFGFNLQNMLFFPPSNSTGIDFNGDTFDFLVNAPGSSASGNLSLSVEAPKGIPEPATASLGLLTLAGLAAATRRRAAR